MKRPQYNEGDGREKMAQLLQKPVFLDLRRRRRMRGFVVEISILFTKTGNSDGSKKGWRPARPPFRMPPFHFLIVVLRPLSPVLTVSSPFLRTFAFDRLKG